MGSPNRVRESTSGAGGILRSRGMRVDILSIFPAIFDGFLGESMVRIAREKGLLELFLHDFRAFAEGPRRSVDDKPFGGGPGRVLKPEPIIWWAMRCSAQMASRRPRASRSSGVTSASAGPPTRSDV